MDFFCIFYIIYIMLTSNKVTKCNNFYRRNSAVENNILCLKSNFKYL